MEDVKWVVRSTSPEVTWEFQAQDISLEVLAYGDV